MLDDPSTPLNASKEQPNVSAIVAKHRFRRSRPVGPSAAGFDEPSADAMRARGAGRLLGLEPDLLELLLQPRRTVEVTIPVRMDDGRRRTFMGLRVQHSVTRGPSKGGLRLHPGVSRRRAQDLAMAMTWRAALVNVPFGGASGAVVCDPAGLSAGEVERIVRRYTSEMVRFIGADRDVISADLGVGERELGWVRETYAALTGDPGGGSVGLDTRLRDASGVLRPASAWGLLEVVRLAAREVGIDGAVRVAVAGHGVGALVSLLGDSDGIELVAAAAPDVPVRAALSADCDVLVVIGGDALLRAADVGHVRAAAVIEGTDGALTDAADMALAARGVCVVPDLVADAGGVVASHLDWIQEVQGLTLSDEEVAERVSRSVCEAFATVAGFADEVGVRLREAALAVGMQRVADAHLARGLYP